MAFAPVLAALHPGIPLLPPPPLPAEERPIRQAEGSLIRSNGLSQPARWRIERGELWLTLEFLEQQLGVQRSTGERGPAAGVVWQRNQPVLEAATVPRG